MFLRRGAPSVPGARSRVAPATGRPGVRLGTDQSEFCWAAHGLQRGGLTFEEAVSYVLRLRISCAVLAGLTLNVLTMLIFAALFSACGEECFTLKDGFDYWQMMWLSAHTFTTVGYGSIFPVCSSGQVLVILEQYMSLVLGGFVCSIILVRAMRPAARFRFAEVALIMLGDENDKARISIRVANISRYGLENVRAEIRCMLALGRRGFMNIDLPLVNGAISHIEAGAFWNIAHTLDVASPLAEHGGLDRDSDGVLENSELVPLYENIVWIDVMVSAQDAVYGQEVRGLHRYYLRDCVAEAKWEDMTSMRVLKKKADGTPALTCFIFDHSKFDSYIAGVEQSAEARKDSYSSYFTSRDCPMNAEELPAAAPSSAGATAG